MSGRTRVPHDGADDYTAAAATERRAFLRERTGVELEHIARYSFDPHVTRGNIERFIGAAQVPIGVAGPLLVDGEHAQGEFYVPLATAEGTLVASYNRGMRLLHEAGGVRTTVVADRMQRAPVFIFPSAREGRAFGVWLGTQFEAIKAAAEATTSVGRLLEIEQYAAGRQVYTRFDYSTGDAAGQNMTGKATQAACRWIVEHYPDIEDYLLEGSFATDKKSSQINMLRTRGKRVVAEATIPALIVATYGGGTGLSTQRECLELLGCYGEGKVAKLAEIIAATVLCGELSLGSAVVAREWVDAHDQLGRNRD
ncbi:MAG: hydroxymethylglutaryl-CoA reductase [Solirubrobacteraceae bacterium]|jgi:hydroxymethylglutaryl-CoA reductase (NADPH)